MTSPIPPSDKREYKPSIDTDQKEKKKADVAATSISRKRHREFESESLDIPISKRSPAHLSHDLSIRAQVDRPQSDSDSSDEDSDYYSVGSSSPDRERLNTQSVKGGRTKLNSIEKDKEIGDLSSMGSLDFQYEDSSEQDDDISEIYSFYDNTDSCEDDPIPGFQGERMAVRPAKYMKPDAEMKKTLSTIKKLLSLPTDFTDRYSQTVLRVAMGRSEFSVASDNFPSEKIKKMARKLFDLIESNGIKEPEHCREEGWPWVSKGKLKGTTKKYVEKINPAMALCEDLVYRMEASDLSIEERNIVFTKLVSMLTEHTKLASCGDFSHFGANFFLEELSREKLPVRLALTEFQLFSQESEGSPDSGFKIANHMFLTLAPLKTGGNDANLHDLYGSEALVVDPMLKVIMKADDENLVPFILESFNLRETQNFRFHYTFFY
ncbi:hypothetical protein [Endozoicomonas arenosclerae]|uniref:hypothetical protein n=1 Tax=Endozoicomonas arenosclerae TaxID=1633495 RepID=UPI0007824172|nr:hypothetical protein [Endozoicomonas arenosclerae]